MAGEKLFLVAPRQEKGEGKSKVKGRGRSRSGGRKVRKREFPKGKLHLTIPAGPFLKKGTEIGGLHC